MNVPSSRQVLKLYRDLLRYGEKLKLTDRKFYRNRIKKEFQDNRNLTSLEDISFNFQRGTTFLQNARVV